MEGVRGRVWEGGREDGKEKGQFRLSFPPSLPSLAFISSPSLTHSHDSIRRDETVSREGGWMGRKNGGERRKGGKGERER